MHAACAAVVAREQLCKQLVYEARAVVQDARDVRLVIGLQDNRLQPVQASRSI